jgi:hypothetical protein
MWRWIADPGDHLTLARERDCWICCLYFNGQWDGILEWSYGAVEWVGSHDQLRQCNAIDSQHYGGGYRYLWHNSGDGHKRGQDL